MVYKDYEEIPNALLRDAIFITTLKDITFCSARLAPDGWAVQFYGKMEIEDIKDFLFNLIPANQLNSDSTPDDLECKYGWQYEYIGNKTIIWPEI